MEEKKPRKRKSLKVTLENKSQEPKQETVEVKEAVKVPKLDPKGMYEFVSNGTFRTMPKGSVWKVTGESAMIFFKNGYGSLKK